MLSFKKHDAYGQELKPGDVCVRQIRGGQYDRTMEFCVYKGEVRESRKGQFGRFVTPTGTRSIKYTSVIFAFDPMGERRSKAEQVNQVVKEYYEGVKK